MATRFGTIHALVLPDSGHAVTAAPSGIGVATDVEDLHHSFRTALVALRLCDPPSVTSVLADDFGESTQDYALPSREIPPFLSSYANAIGPSDRFGQVDGVEIAELNKRSRERVDRSKEFADLKQKIEKARAEKGVLRLADLMQEREDAKKNGDGKKPATDLDTDAPGIAAPDDELTVHLATPFDASRVAERHFVATASCGICGKASLDEVEVRCDLIPAGPVVAPSVVVGLPDRLRDAQAVFEATGGLHAAGLFDASGGLVALREASQSFGIALNVRLDDNIHDRSIITNHGWRILLGKGLDIWEPPTNAIAEARQEFRRIKSDTTFTYARTPIEGE